MPLSKTHRVTGIIILNLIYAGILLYVNFDTIITKENTRSVIKNLQRLKLRLEDDSTKKTSDLSDKGNFEEDFSIEALTEGAGKW